MRVVRRKSSIYKGCTVYKDLQKGHFPTLQKKEITTKPQPQSNLYAYSRKLSNQAESMLLSQEMKAVVQLWVNEINLSTQKRAMSLNPGQFIEKFMQEFQKGLKEFIDKTNIWPNNRYDRKHTIERKLKLATWNVNLVKHSLKIKVFIFSQDIDIYYLCLR